MTADSRLPERQFADGQIPIAVQSLCSELSRSGQLYVRQISAFIDEIAPGPGSLVYVHANSLGVQLDGLEPAVFSAIDACTNLQVAQIYLASTAAGALSFVDFFVRRFPFSIQQIRTLRHSPFYGVAGRNDRHDFSAILAQRGILHTLIADKSRDALYSITSRLLFSKMTEGMNGPASEREHYRALTQFLLYHNNYHSIPWLDGNTPLQKLKSFDGYAPLHSFCPFEEADPRTDFRTSEKWKAKESKCQAIDNNSRISEFIR
ncbi:MAG: hypothetical protein NTZ35_00415 [Ignavibacteriales bacterium]|nr:hypothetical protein [Ignavibacteriales bacterium]